MAFTQLLDKGLTREVLLASWCPSMDLLALVWNDHQLTVNRLNMQRLWTSTPGNKISSICWKPNGKALAMTLQSGELCLLDVENGDIQLRTSLSGSIITCMTWTQEAAAHAALSSASEVLQAPRCCQAVSASLAKNGHKRSTGDFSPDGAPSRLPQLPSRLNILCAADAHVGSTLLAFGSFPLASSTLPPHGGSDHSRDILHAELMGDLTKLCTVWRSPTQGELRCLLHSTSCIAERCQEIRHIAFLSSYTTSLLTRATEALSTAAEEWKGAMTAVNDKIAELQRMLDACASDSTALEEFQKLLSKGHLSSGLLAFLTSTLGEAGVKRLARTVDAAVAKVASLLLDHIESSVEETAFHLGETLGLARCSAWMAPLTLQAAAVAEAQEAAHSLLLQTQAAGAALLQAGVHYRTLFAWLLTLCRRLSEDSASGAARKPGFQHDPLAMAAFLKGQFSHDVILPQLDQEGGEHVAPVREDQAQLQRLREILGMANAGPAGTTSLRHQLHRLQEQCGAIYSAVRDSLTPTIQPVADIGLICVPASPDLHPRVAFAVPQEGEVAVRICVLVTNAVGRPLCVLDVPRSRQDDVEAGQVRRHEINLERWGPVVDVGFYKDNHLAALTSGSKEGGRGAHLALLPVPVTQQDDDSAQPSTKQAGQRLAVPWTDTSLRKRALGYTEALTPLAVSGPRGVAFALVGHDRMVLLDLEEDEDDNSSLDLDDHELPDA